MANLKSNAITESVDNFETVNVGVTRRIWSGTINRKIFINGKNNSAYALQSFDMNNLAQVSYFPSHLLDYHYPRSNAEMLEWAVPNEMDKPYSLPFAIANAITAYAISNITEAAQAGNWTKEELEEEIMWAKLFFQPYAEVGYAYRTLFGLTHHKVFEPIQESMKVDYKISFLRKWLDKNSIHKKGPIEYRNQYWEVFDEKEALYKKSEELDTIELKTRQKWAYDGKPERPEPPAWNERYVFATAIDVDYDKHLMHLALFAPARIAVGDEFKQGRVKVKVTKLIDENTVEATFDSATTLPKALDFALFKNHKEVLVDPSIK